MRNTEPDSTQTIALVAPLNNKGLVLLLKRNKQQHCGGLWSFPGGKVEANESSHQAAIRELQEETGLSGSQWQRLGEIDHAYPDRSLKFILFACLCPNTTKLQTETETEHIWVHRDALNDYPMPEANAKLLSMLKAYLEEKP